MDVIKRRVRTAVSASEKPIVKTRPCRLDDFNFFAHLSRPGFFVKRNPCEAHRRKDAANGETVASALGVTRTTLSELVNGRLPETAVRLSKVFGGSAENRLVYNRRSIVWRRSGRTSGS
jgi:plasmid maintenance system antidote protein VapI